ncbi:MAG: GNAT family N-acetyltransferase [Treponema sp.]|jgi:phosphinothricin acetyltransferase|nr:GNAT family N-acetyltransferase [Treponema sp.]
MEINNIRNVKESDAKAILDIYNYYIENTVITFEEIPLSLSEMSARICGISGNFPYLVYEDEGEVTGFAYANTWKERSAYNKTAEISIYLKNGTQGNGRGKMLLKSLLEKINKDRLHLLIAGIALPNEASVKTFECFGFKKIGQFSEAGFKMNMWIDVGYWELVVAE